MDDDRFDDIIKSRVVDYEPPGFDASALTALHHQLHGLNYDPWYSRYRTELLIGAGTALSTILILITLWLLNTERLQRWDNHTKLMQSQQEEIHKLQQTVEALKSAARDRDTVYVVRESLPIKSLLQKIADLEFAIKNLATASSIDQFSESSRNDRIYRSLEPEILFFPLGSINSRPPSEQHLNVASDVKTGQKDFSAETQRKLERHYRNGVGIRVGPTVEFSRGMYKMGAGRFDLTGGLSGDFIVSPSLSVETGVKFIHRFYEIPGDEWVASELSLPNFNSDLGPLVTADVDSWMLEAPVHIKYRMPVSVNSHWLAGIGYSWIATTKQIFEYDYQLGSNSAVRVNESHAFNKLKMYNGTLNISLGLSKQLRNNKILETTLYYQHGLGRTGLEKTDANFLGLRASYWFTVR